MPHENLDPHLPPDPFELPNQTEFNLLSDRQSLVMNAEGFRLHNALKQHPAESDPDVYEVLPTGEGHVHLEGDKLRVQGEAGTPLEATALFAGHLAVRMGEDIHVGYGMATETNDEGQSIKVPDTVMPITPYVRELQADPDQMYGSEHTEFNFAVHDAYASRMTMPEEMQLDPEGQLVAAHAARRLSEDESRGKFPSRLDQAAAEADIAEFEQAARRDVDEQFKQIVEQSGIDGGPNPQ